jgi:hypothetical protein
MRNPGGVYIDISNGVEYKPSWNVENGEMNKLTLKFIKPAYFLSKIDTCYPFIRRQMFPAFSRRQ